MQMTELIAQKKRGDALSPEQIRWWIAEFTAGTIPDYQAAALLMAICLRGMAADETVALTMAMAYSGATVDLRGIRGVKVDKHSTGGVGDTTTLICAPLAAACGIQVAKVSGRGLGHTGGTIDKLQSIPGFNAALTPGEFVRIVSEVGIAITGQSEDLVPADRLLYALRDVTATVDSLPLIASSIMSKKIAAGADAIVLDVKTGSGAFLSSTAEAQALAKTMVAIGEGVGRRTVALITDMDQPLGSAIGNALEVREAVEVLRGGEQKGDLTTLAMRGPLRELSLVLAAEMLLAGEHQTGGRASTPEQARAAVEDALSTGRGLQTFARMVEAQGGDRAGIDNPGLLPQALHQTPVLSTKTSWITRMDTQAIGRAAMLLGAGRARAGDAIDLAAGMVLFKHNGDAIRAGEPLAMLHTSRPGSGGPAEVAGKALIDAIETGEQSAAQARAMPQRIAH